MVFIGGGFWAKASERGRAFAYARPSIMVVLSISYVYKNNFQVKTPQ